MTTVSSEITGHFHELLHGVLFVVTMPQNELEDVCLNLLIADGFSLCLQFLIALWIV